MVTDPLPRARSKTGDCAVTPQRCAGLRPPSITFKCSTLLCIWCSISQAICAASICACNSTSDLYGRCHFGRRPCDFRSTVRYHASGRENTGPFCHPAVSGHRDHLVSQSSREKVRRRASGAGYGSPPGRAPVPIVCMPMILRSTVSELTWIE